MEIEKYLYARNYIFCQNRVRALCFSLTFIMSGGAYVTSFSATRVLMKD